MDCNSQVAFLLKFTVISQSYTSDTVTQCIKYIDELSWKYSKDYKWDDSLRNYNNDCQFPPSWINQTYRISTWGWWLHTVIIDVTEENTW